MTAILCGACDAFAAAPDLGAIARSRRRPRGADCARLPNPWSYGVTSITCSQAAMHPPAAADAGYGSAILLPASSAYAGP